MGQGVEFQKRYLDKIVCCPVGILAPLLIAGALGGGQLPRPVEIARHEPQAAIFSSGPPGLILIRVVVRDAQGKSMTGLHAKDFQIFSDQHKQAIARFAVEGLPTPPPTGEKLRAAEGALPPGRGERRTALFFDDYHLAPMDVEAAREAADHFLGESLEPGEHVGIFSASGQVSADFTANPYTLRQALAHLRALSRFQTGGYCPDVTPYHAQMILEKSEADALPLAVALTFLCQCRCPTTVDTALSTAMLISIHSEIGAEATLKGLAELVHRVEGFPGPRTIALISGGFLSGTHAEQVDALVDRALRQGITISALDARGFCNILPAADPAQPGQSLSRRDAAALGKIVQRSDEADAVVLKDLAAGTGGAFVHDPADFEAGLRHLGSPEVSYLLGFSPQNVSPQDDFHRISVTLVKPAPWSVYARRGYCAARRVQ